MGESALPFVGKNICEHIPTINTNNLRTPSKAFSDILRRIAIVKKLIVRLSIRLSW
jgi:hypothetical protein